MKGKYGTNGFRRVAGKVFKDDSGEVDRRIDVYAISGHTAGTRRGRATRLVVDSYPCGAEYFQINHGATVIHFESRSPNDPENGQYPVF
ncbi:hypothetical protein ACFLQN_03740 [Candidatus Aenigmatarchaeota archaeon]